MADEIKKQEELSDDELGNVVGGRRTSPASGKPRPTGTFGDPVPNPSGPSPTLSGEPMEGEPNRARK